MIQPKILSAGAALLSESRRDSPSFTVSIWFPYGSRNEAPMNRGFVHFVEHMLFKGTKRHDAFSLWRAIERTGGYANGFTERDCICVYCCVPSRDWRLAAELIAEVAFSSTFPVQEFEKEKQVILSEILQIEDDVEETAFDAFLAHFWPDHPAAKPIGGSCAEVEAIDRGRLFDFYRGLFTVSNAIIAASGDFDEAGLAEFMDEAIAKAAVSDGASADAAAGRAVAGTSAEAVSAVFSLAYPGTPAARAFRGYTKAPSSQIYYFDALQLDAPLAMKDFFCLSAINGILGEASTSRLFQKVREKLGLAYTVQSSLSFSRTEALVAIQVVMGDNKFVECVNAVDEETKALFASTLSDEELTEAASRLAGSFVLSLEDPESRIRRLASWYMTLGKIPDMEEERQMYLNVERDDVLALLTRLASARRGRYAYGSIKPRTARTLGLEEI